MPTSIQQAFPVTISVIDSNGNYRDIGTATSDASGTFTFQWTPDITGEYTVIATFAGSESYYSSYSETGFAVDEPHATASPTDTPVSSTADTYFVPAVAGIVVVLIVILAMQALILLRKRP